MAHKKLEDMVAADVGARKVRKRGPAPAHKLEAHFRDDKGLRLSQGLRMIITEYMRRERL